jgi:hypothetical protein
MLIVRFNTKTDTFSLSGNVAGCPVNIPNADNADVYYWQNEAKENEEGICKWYSEE